MSHLTALKSIAYREVKRVFRIRIQTLVPPIINTTLYLVIFWVLLGSTIPDIHGMPYINYLIPWFLMMSLIMASYMNVSSSFFGAKFQKSIEEILTAPIPGYIVILWYISGWITRGMIISAIIFCVSLFFTSIHIEHIFITFLFLLFTSSLFSLLGLFNAFFAKSFDSVNLIPTFIITPMIYLGGVFYSISALPTFWQYFTMVNPIYYMINGLRFGFYGISEVNPLYSLAAIILCNIVFFYINKRMYETGYGLKN